MTETELSSMDDQAFSSLRSLVAAEAARRERERARWRPGLRLPGMRLEMLRGREHVARVLQAAAGEDQGNGRHDHA